MIPCFVPVWKLVLVPLQYGTRRTSREEDKGVGRFLTMDCIYPWPPNSNTLIEELSLKAPSPGSLLQCPSTRTLFARRLVRIGLWEATGVQLCLLVRNEVLVCASPAVLALTWRKCTRSVKLEKQWKPDLHLIPTSISNANLFQFDPSCW